MYDIVLKNGKIIDSTQKLESKSDIAISRGRIKAIGSIAESSANKVVDLSNAYVTPGFVDIHTHVMEKITYLGVSPDIQLHEGVTTVIDAGSLGPGNYASSRTLINNARSTIYTFVNLGFAGIAFFMPNGQTPDIPFKQSVDVNLLKSVIEQNHEIRGIKVRPGKFSSGELGIWDIETAVSVSSELGLRTVSHVGNPPPDIDGILDALGSDSVLTHAFRGGRNSLIDYVDKAKKLQKNGMIIDIGHGSAGFSFESAKYLMDNGLIPDTLSSDIHIRSIMGPCKGLVETMNKFIALDMDLTDIIAKVTAKPREIFDLDEGTLFPGSKADIAVFTLEKKSRPLEDTEGNTVISTEIISPKFTLKKGVFVQAR